MTAKGKAGFIGAAAAIITFLLILPWEEDPMYSAWSGQEYKLATTEIYYDFWCFDGFRGNCDRYVAFL